MRPSPRYYFLELLPSMAVSALLADYHCWWPKRRNFVGPSMTKRYPLPPELARHAHGGSFAPGELREACRAAGEGLGRADVHEARFRSAAEMVALWEGLDLPAWEAPYVLRDARLGYVAGYGEALVSGELSEDATNTAAEARWGYGWREKLHAARERKAKPN